MARPILSRQTDVLHYSIRHPDTGAWITNTYRVRAARSSSPRAGSTPSNTRPWTSSPSCTPNRHTCWCWPCPAPGGGDHHVFHALVPVHQPNGDCGTGCWAPSTRTDGPGPAPSGSSRESTGPCAAWWKESRKRKSPSAGRGRAMGDILTGTPPDLTYLHPFVREAWMVVWAVTSGALVVILGWMGLSFIVQEHLGHHQSGWREMVPRLVLGLTAAASSSVVVRPGHRRGSTPYPSFIAAELNVTPGDLLRAPLEPLLNGGAGRQHRAGGVHRPALPGLRLLHPLPAGADDPAPGPHRHPALPWPPSPWGCGFCPTPPVGGSTGCGCS